MEMICADVRHVNRNFFYIFSYALIATYFICRGVMPTVFVTKGGPHNSSRIKNSIADKAEDGAYVLLSESGTFDGDAWALIYKEYYHERLKKHRALFLKPDDVIVFTCDGFGAHSLTVSVLDLMRSINVNL